MQHYLLLPPLDFGSFAIFQLLGFLFFLHSDLLFCEKLIESSQHPIIFFWGQKGQLTQTDCTGTQDPTFTFILIEEHTQAAASGCETWSSMASRGGPRASS